MGDETSIQAAITSLAPGGSRDDGNLANNIVRILDDALYSEALTVGNYGLTLESTGPNRPRIVTTNAAAAVNANNVAIRIVSDHVVTLRGLIILPDFADPPAGALVVDDASNVANVGYTIHLEDVLVAGNDGANQPASADGLVTPTDGFVGYSGWGVDFNSTPTNSGAVVTMRNTVVTAATTVGSDLVRVFTDFGTVTVQDGCVFSYSGRYGLFFSAANSTSASIIGTQASPVIIHGNQSTGLRNSATATALLNNLEWVAITRNSLAANQPALLCAYTGTDAHTWRHVTIAGNEARDSSGDNSGAIRVAMRNLDFQNVILAGDGSQSPAENRNLLDARDSAGLLITGSHVAVDLSFGGTSLNRRFLDAGGDPLNGILGNGAFAPGTITTIASPQFLALEPANPNYLVLANSDFATIGPAGGPLTGVGSYGPPPAVVLTTQSGNLQTLLNGETVAPRLPNNVYGVPTLDEVLIFRHVMDDVLNRRYAAAAAKAALVNYDVFFHRDTVNNLSHLIVREKATNRNWRGIYAFNLKPGRLLVFESPHPLFDGTREQGIDLYVATQAAAFSQAGIHRNNCLIEAGCSGMQTSGDPYWISDMAHTTVSFFQVMHEQTDLLRPDHVFVSVHGMADTSNTEEVSISNGTTTDVVGASRSKTLANLMNAILIDAGDPRRAVSHQEPGENPSLSGSTNTQGRFTNGSRLPCTVAAPGVPQPERFIHMEQKGSVRNPPASNWSFVTQSFYQLIDAEPVLQCTPFGDPVALEVEWPLDGNGNGSEVTDPSLTLVNSPAAAENRFNHPTSALGFDGNQRYLVAPQNKDLDEAGAFSLAFWVRAPQLAGRFQYLASRGTVGTGDVAGLAIPSSLHLYSNTSDGRLRVRMTSGDGITWSLNSTTVVADDNWHHIAITWACNDGARVYVDGVEVGSNSDLGGAVFLPEGPWFFGARTDLDAARFLGDGSSPARLDDIRLFRGVLTPAEVLAIFEENSGLSSWALF
jgi:hypothetical protein